MKKFTKRWRVLALAMAVSGAALVVLGDAGTALATTITLSGKQKAPLFSGTMELNANEFNSSATFQIQSDGGADFKVTKSSINQTTVGAYPSLSVGRHGGFVTQNDPFPLQLSSIVPGEVKTSVVSVTPSTATGTWHDFYDIYLEPNPTANQYSSTREELVIFQNRHPTGVGGTLVATGVSLDGHLYNVYHAGDNIVKCVPQTYSDSFSGDLLPFFQDSVKRGFAQSSWYLVDIEHGFEIQSGDVIGLGDSSFSVHVGSRVIGW